MDLCESVSETPPVLSSFIIDNSVNIIFTCNNSPPEYVNEDYNIRVGMTVGNYTLTQLTEQLTQDLLNNSLFEDGTQVDIIIINSCLNVKLKQKNESTSCLNEMFGMNTDLSGHGLSVDNIYFDALMVLSISIGKVIQYNDTVEDI